MINWLEVRIWFKEGKLNYKELILNSIKPIVDELDSKNLCETFHFFFEPDPHFLLRIKLRDIVNLDSIKKIVSKYLITSQIERFEFSDKYKGEEENYGKDGWKIAEKLFEYGCRFAILKLSSDKDVKTDKDFNERKFVHCFLNQNLINYINEGKFYKVGYEGIKQMLKERGIEI